MKTSASVFAKLFVPAVLLVLVPRVSAAVYDKSGMPSLVQVDFGPFGSYLPGDGQDYCVPTSGAMLFFWLSQHGYSQLAPAYAGEAQLQEKGLNLDRVFAGLMNASRTGGTTNAGYMSGIDDYLNARGVSSIRRTWDTSNNPSLAWLNAHNGPNSVVLAALSWYSQDGASNNYFFNGGHGTALVRADPNTGTNNFTVNNPYPSTFFNVPNIPSENPLTVTAIPVPGNWTLEYDTNPPYIQVVTPILGPGNPGGLAVYDTGIALALDEAAKPASPGYAPQTWTINSTKTLDTNGGNLEVIAPLTGAGGLHKTGKGELLLAAANALQGANTIGAGQLVSTAATGTPFGTGGITINGTATLGLRPDDAAPAAVALSIASGANGRLLVQGGAAGITLDRGSNTSLTATVGGYTTGNEKNFLLADHGTLVVSPAGGWADLGAGVRLLSAGGTGNQPAPESGMLTPDFVVQNNDSARSGAFATYDSSTGFIPAATTGGDLNAATSSAIYSTSADQTIATTAGVRALALAGATVTGGGLVVGTQAAGSQAGIILNGGALGGSAIAFGAADAYIYTSGAGGSVAGTIVGSGALTTFGPGTLSVSGNSSSTLTGGINVNSGTLALAGGRTGSGDTVVRNDAKLVVSNSGVVGGNVTVHDNATATLDGGTIHGNLTLDSTAALNGSGTIAGNATISGSVSGHTSGPAGSFAFDAPAVFENGSQFFLALNSLTTDPSQAGIAWNTLDFSSSVEFGNTQNSNGQTVTVYLNITPALDPNTDTSGFWDTAQRWDFASGPADAFHHASYSLENWSWFTGSFEILKNSATGYNDLSLVFTPVPEPSVLALALSSCCLVAFSRRFP